MQPLLITCFHCLSIIEYPNYKFYLPIRAMGKYEQTYLPWFKQFNEWASAAF